MIRPELHSVRRPFFDCTSYRRPPVNVSVDPAKAIVDESLHLHAEMTRTLPRPSLRYNEIRALRLAA